MKQTYKVFYKANGYKSDTMVGAESKEQAAAVCLVLCPNAVEVTSVIGPLIETSKREKE